MPAPDRDSTPVATIRPIGRGEIAGVDDLVDFTGGQSAAAARRRRRWKIVRRSLLAMFLLVAGYYAITLLQVYQTGRSDQARPVDAIVVLGAAQYDGTPSPQLAARLDHVVTLYNEGVAPLVVVTGGKQPSDRFTEAESSARYLAERGIPSEAIAMESAGRSTYQSLANTAELLAQRGLERVVVVTDPYHAPAVTPDRRGRRADGLRVADAELGGARSQLGAPPPRRSRRCRPRPHRRLREPLTAHHPSAQQRPSAEPSDRGAPRTPMAAGTLHGRSDGEWCNWQHSRFWFCY